jgi:hypothetical protein
VPGQPNNPLGIENAAAALDRIEALLNVCLALLVLVCAASVVVRFRRAGGVERQQLKWFAYGAGQLALLLGSGLGLSGLWKRVPQGVSDLLFAMSFALIPVAIGIAILRYRLYDSTGSSAAPWSMGCSAPCWPPSTPAWSSARASCLARLVPSP